ncbi:MAG: hypothetical protein AAFO84_00615 [Cyanobacteria bacterium J06598_1]
MLYQAAQLLLIVACLAAPLTHQQHEQAFANRASNTYRYTAVASNQSPARTWLLKKSGSAVVGIELANGADNERDRITVLNCFRGQASGNQIRRVTQVSWPYTPAAHWELGETIEIAAPTSQSSLSQSSLSQSSLVETTLAETTLSADEAAALTECVQAFSR